MVSPGFGREAQAWSGGVLAAASERRRSTVRRVERGVGAGREAEAQVGAVDQETHGRRPEAEGRRTLARSALRWEGEGVVVERGGKQKQGLLNCIPRCAGRLAAAGSSGRPG